ncbi:MAG: hypothetical protein V2A61_05320, partial [Calditrichota bacterium]
FLWHLHQPDYRDAATGKFLLPWVRLHACSGYNDMLELALKFPEARHTLNFTPVLLDQLQVYSEGSADDLYLNVTQIAPADLTLEQRGFILDNFFQANPATQIMPHPRYRELYLRRERTRRRIRGENLNGQFSDRDVRDLQVWFNLTWMGWQACRLEPVKAFLDKGNDFREEDKIELVKIQRELIQGVLAKLRKVVAETSTELTFTPFYHPIAPLLCDTDSMQVARPDQPRPQVRFHHPEDLQWQVQEGMALFERVTGQKPCGMWPAEGSVSLEALKIFAAAGVQWLVTDEDICARSLPALTNPLDIHRPHRLEDLSDGPSIFFRQRELSDAIGFRYQLMPPTAAVEDLTNRLVNLADAMPDKTDRMVVLALDGENPWGYYPDCGEGFLTGLTTALAQHPRLQMQTISGFLQTAPLPRKLTKLHSGSWISGDFHIWIGDPVKNRAWELLNAARDQAALRGNDISPEAYQAVMRHLHAAEGSDWFWWFGEPNYSPADPIFDQLFRSRLRQIYRLCGSAVPPRLFQPLGGASERSRSQQPRRFIKPVIDGKVTSYYEWLGAGEVDRLGELVRPTHRYWIERVLFGYDIDYIYIRVDLNAPASTAAELGWQLKVVIEEPRRQVWRLIGKLETDELQGQTQAATVIESRLPRTELGLSLGSAVAFYLLCESPDCSERFPYGREIRFQMGSEAETNFDWYM